jgi:hypothetical protein
MGSMVDGWRLRTNAQAPRCAALRSAIKSGRSVLRKQRFVARWFEGKLRRNSAMSQAKRASRGKRPSKAVSVLGIAGVSLAASTGGSPADILSQNMAPFQGFTLGEEEISDVSLATFHLFDKENLGSYRSGIQLAAVRACGGGCGCGHGCGGCRGCGGVRACRVGGCGVGGCRACRVGGCGGCGCGGWGGCGGCGWGWGWGGCCLSWGGCGLC